MSEDVAARENRIPDDEQVQFVYHHQDGDGFGEHHFNQEFPDPAVQLHPEMKELDLKDGTVVTHYAHDADTGWPIVNWTDAVGNPRMTTVDPDFFDEHFTEV